MIRSFLIPLFGCFLILTSCLKAAKVPPKPLPLPKPVITTDLPRLSHMQWENAVKDVLLLDQTPGLADQFTADPSSLFDNDRDFLKVSPNLWADYQEAAESVARKIAENPAQVKKFIPDNAPLDPKERAASILQPLTTRAFRRPIDAQTLEQLVGIFLKGPELTAIQDPDRAGLQAAISFILQSPYFIYRIELDKEPEVKAEPEAKNDAEKMHRYEVASRLSFALWNSIPDDILLAAADQKNFLDHEQIRLQIDRMMQDPRSTAMLNFFLARVFHIDSFAHLTKDPIAVPHWPQDLGDSLRREAELFLNEVITVENGGLNSILTAPYTFVNAATAPLYGVEGIQGSEFIKVNLDPRQRYGILTQLGFLAKNARTNETDPIHRGVFINSSLLCAKLAPPPGVLQPLPDIVPNQTTRDRVTAHTGKGTCGESCHGNIINPAGFAFENYDAAGRWRTEDNGFAVNAADIFAFQDSLVSFNGAIEFIQVLTQRNEVHECFVGKAFELIYGRPAEEPDQALVQKIAAKSRTGLATKDIIAELLLDEKITQ